MPILILIVGAAILLGFSIYIGLEQAGLI